MSRRFVEMGALALVALALLSIPTSSRGQGCTADEQERITVVQHAAILRLQDYDLAGHQALLESLDAALSASCRAELNRIYPARTRCTTLEREAAITRLHRVVIAAAAGEAGRVLDALSAIDDAVSEECWLALNYSTRAAVHASCDSSERAFLARASRPALTALHIAYHTGDRGPAAEVADAMDSNVTEDCRTAVQAVHAATEGGPAAAGTPAVSNVYDHGNGTYSVPGVGACTPSACMAF